MSSDICLQYADRRMTAQPGESVLDVLLKDGHEIPYGCRAGVCQSCLLQSKSGEPGAKAQQGLQEAQKAMNYFLACQCVPAENMHLAMPGRANFTVPAKVLRKHWLNDSILELVLSADLQAEPGQYFTLWRDERVGRSYSLASINAQGELSFHLKVLPQGQFSAWAAAQLDEGDEIRIQGPMGTCIYQTPTHSPILMVGIGTGLAPLFGILNKAIENGHSANIELVLAARSESDFYLRGELSRLVTHCRQLSIHWVAQHLGQGHAVHGDVYDYVKENFADLNGYQVYLCGAQSFVHKMKKQCFIGGVAMRNIFADAFVAS